MIKTALKVKVSAMIFTLNLLLMSTFSPLAETSGKKGAAAWAPNLLCDDFRVLNNMSWWYALILICYKVNVFRLLCFISVNLIYVLTFIYQQCKTLT